MEINDIVPVSLKYLQHTNRIITSKDYIKQDEKKDKRKVVCGKPDVSEATGGFCQHMGYLLVPSWTAAWQGSWNILT